MGTQTFSRCREGEASGGAGFWRASSQQNVESVDRTLLSESNHLQAGDENCLYDQSNRSYARMAQA